MFYYMQSFLIVVLEILCCKIFYETFGKKRTEDKRWSNYGIIMGIIILVFLAAVFLQERIVIKQIFIIISTAVLMMAYIKISLWKSIILSMLYQGLVLVIDYVSLLFNITVFQSVSQIETTYIVQGHLLVVFGKILLFIMVLVIKKNIGKDSLDMLMDTEWLRFIVFPIFTICVITAMIGTSGGIRSQKQENLFLVIAIGLVGINIAIFYLISDILKRERKIREDNIFRLQVKNQTDMYRSISENYDKQRKKTHEYKNQIMCMESLMDKRRYDELENYIKQIGGNLSRERNYLSTNNVFVDAILNTKFREIEEKGIVLVFRINELSDLNISDEDIVVMLSNLLNNAIEACEKCRNQKVIKLKFVKEEDAVVLSIKNTHNNKIIYREGEIQTSKTNSDEHGIGIKNIIETIKKYGGSYVIQNDEQEFYFSIVIPLCKNNISV